MFNVDGVSNIENHWLANHKMIEDRKNRDSTYSLCPTSTLIGVDLNRNFGVDFGQQDEILKYQKNTFENEADVNQSTNACSTYYPGPEAFSEPETRAFRDFLTEHKDEIKFVLNIHSTGNAFIYPFNGRKNNDIE